MNPDVQYWLNLSSYDLKTAQAMLKTKRYLYVLFMCQQSLEKLLKAFVVQETKAFPPRIHDLPRLAKLASLHLADDEVDFLKQLAQYYIETRYPADVQKLMRTVNRKLATAVYKRTRSLWKELSDELS